MAAQASDLRRFIIKAGYPCNNACIFCHASDQPSTLQLTTPEVEGRIAQAKAMGATGILFSGGEPTIRNDLPELAAYCHKQGLRPGLITNGRMLSYKPLLRRLVKAGLDYVYMSLHGPRSIHEAITQVPGSFVQSWRAITLLAGLEQVALTVNTVVVKQNLNHLQAVANLLAPLPRVRIKFTYVEPKGSALQDPDVVPPPEAAARAIAGVLDRTVSPKVPLARFGVDGLPHCLDGRFAPRQDDMFSHGICALREVDEADFFPIDYANMYKPAACRGCLLGDECRGTWRKTIDRFGADFLAPVYGGLSNSFSYFPASEAANEARTVRVTTADSPQLFVTDTGDYTDERIAQIRDELGQLYWQLDDQPMVNDFPGQLRKLAPIAEPAGHYAPEDGDPFGPAELRVRRILASLKGRVLDVGCGQTRYQDLLDEKFSSGDISYIGLDPHPGAEVQEMAAKGRIELRATGVEEAAFSPGEFDWILVLRSHNHLADLWTAYGRMLAALKWGGRMLVVDNVSFGLVRPHVDRADIEAIPAGSGLEHLRDHDHGAAEAFFKRFPLTLVTRHAVSPETANQWLLLYQKLWPGGQTGKDTYPAAPIEA